MPTPFPLDTDRALHAHDKLDQATPAQHKRRIISGKAAQDPAASPAAAAPALARLRKSGTQPSGELPREKHRVPCPHCEQPAVIRTSVQISRVTREYQFCCTNAECGHTFVALMEAIRTLSPSAIPDAGVHLPLSSHVRRELLRAQLDQPVPAGHGAAAPAQRT